MSSAPPRRVVLGAAVAALLLLLAAPSPGSAVRALRAAADATDPTGPLVALVALLAWVLAGWLLLTALLTTGAHLPGLVGRLLDAVARRVAPAAVRRAVEVALGLTVAVGALGASPAAAASGADVGPAAATASLDWGAAGPVDAGGGLDRPAAGAPATTRPSAPPAARLDWPGVDAPVPADATADDAARPADAVVVQPGDTLWGLAAEDLQARGSTAPSNADIAQAWPTWWAANRDAVGDDPDLLHPGTPLLRPPADGGTPPAP